MQWQPLVLPSYRVDSRAVFVVGPAGPTTETGPQGHTGPGIIKSQLNQYDPNLN
jgi:hypothetical protein